MTPVLVSVIGVPFVAGHGGAQAHEYSRSPASWRTHSLSATVARTKRVSRDNMYTLFYDVKIATRDACPVARAEGAGLAGSRRRQQNASMTWDVYALRAPLGAR